MHWVKLPSGEYLNLAHIVYAFPDTRGGLYLRLAVPNYDRNEDGTGGTDLMPHHLSGLDADALTDWLDRQGPDLGSDLWRLPR